MIHAAVIGQFAGAAEGFVEIADGFSTGGSDNDGVDAFNTCMGEYVESVANEILEEECNRDIKTKSLSYMKAARVMIATVNASTYNIEKERGVTVSCAPLTESE